MNSRHLQWTLRSLITVNNKYSTFTITSVSQTDCVVPLCFRFSKDEWFDVTDCTIYQQR